MLDVIGLSIKYLANRMVNSAKYIVRVYVLINRLSLRVKRTCCTGSCRFQSLSYKNLYKEEIN